ncbi:hypothetical protein HYT57_02160 [Candidatus Woesearchaeota archaeon]|nr:hypothetical protein [Candidatus Woesearchaeota archaeon]
MGFFRGLGTVFVSILLIFTVFTASIGVTVYSIMLYPDVYKEALEKVDVEKLAQEKIPLKDIPIPIPPELASENLKKTFFILLSDVLAYARSDKNELTFKINVNQDEILSFFEQQAQAFPVCSANQIPFENGEPKCRPAQIPVKEFLITVLEQKNFSIGQISNADLIQVWDPQNNRAKLRQYVTWFRYGIYASLLLILLLVSFIWLLRKPSIKSFARTIGINFILVGSMLLAIFFVANKIPITHLPEGFAELALSVIDVFKEAILGKILIFGVVFVLIGVIGLIFSFIKKDKLEPVKKVKKVSKKK